MRKSECGKQKKAQGLGMRSNLILFVLVLVNQNYIEYDDEGGNCRTLANNAPSFRIPHSHFRILFAFPLPHSFGTHSSFRIPHSEFPIPIFYSGQDDLDLLGCDAIELYTGR